jgi:hypothetical protein
MWTGFEDKRPSIERLSVSAERTSFRLILPRGIGGACSSWGDRNNQTETYKRENRFHFNVLSTAS